jgi:hypothetical protein
MAENVLSYGNSLEIPKDRSTTQPIELVYLHPPFNW